MYLVTPTRNGYHVMVFHQVESCIFNLVGCLHLRFFLHQIGSKHLSHAEMSPGINALSDEEAEQEAVASKLLQSWLQSLSAEEVPGIWIKTFDDQSIVNPRTQLEAPSLTNLSFFLETLL